MTEIIGRVDEVRAKISKTKKPFENITIGGQSFYIWEENFQGVFRAGDYVEGEFVEENNFKVIKKIALVPEDVPEPRSEPVASTPKPTGFEGKAQSAVEKWITIANRLISRMAEEVIVFEDRALASSINTLYINLSREGR